MTTKKTFSIILVLLAGIAIGLGISRFEKIKMLLYPRLKWVLNSRVYPKVITKAGGDSLKLCYFEDVQDIRKVETSNVKVEQSGQKVSEGSFSLKCEFADGGGAIGFFDNLPRDWQGYQSLIFDVYSGEDGIPLSVFITDPRNSSYGDRFNRDNIRLKQGWNSISIPLADISAKVILSKIQHLRLFLWQVKGRHTLYFDNLRLGSPGDNSLSAKFDSGLPIVIKINPAKEKGRVSPLLYGSNFSYKMESNQAIKDFIKDTGITCLRFPGGGTDGWHWRTGSADFSVKIKDMPLADINYLVEFCRQTNTRLIIQVNIESGSPREAAEFVEFMNKKNNFRVEYWELGNEAYGSWDRDFTTPLKYAQLIREYSLAMKSVDPTIKIGANWGESYYDSVKWDETIVREAADYFDFISVHWYPNHINASHKYEGRIRPEPLEVIANARQIPKIVARFNGLIERFALHRRGKIEVTFLEWDGAWDAPSSDPDLPYAQGIVQWSLANALFYGDCLGQFAENNVSVSAHYNLQECMFGLIRGWDPAEGWGGMKWDMQTIRPKAMALKLFSHHFGDTLLESSVENSPSYIKEQDWWPSSYAGEVPYISCYASKFSGNGRLGLIFINKHPDQDYKVKVMIDSSVTVDSETRVWLLNGPNILSQNDGQPGTVSIQEFSAGNTQNQFGYTLPAHSMTAMEIGVSGYETISKN